MVGAGNKHKVAMFGELRHGGLVADWLGLKLRGRLEREGGGGRGGGGGGDGDDG